MSKKIKDLPIYGGTSLGWLEDAEEVEKKELLLKDICARLPYGVKVTWDGIHPLTVTPHVYCSIASVSNLPKLLLRPMSSMTEEERLELSMLSDNKSVKFYLQGKDVKLCFMSGDCFKFYKVFDWLNAHHFDFRNLIECGLAIDCTGLNVY